MKKIKAVYRLASCAIAAALLFPLALTGCDAGVTELDSPTGVKASADGLHSVKVSWTETEDATGYTVSIFEKEEPAGGASEPDSSDESASSESSSGGSASDESISEESASGEMSDSGSGNEDVARPPYSDLRQEVEATEAVFNGLKADTDYEVTVTAVYQDESRRVESEPSKPAAIRTGAPEVGTAEGLAASAEGETRITVAWEPYSTEETNADGLAAQVFYTLYVSDSEDGDYTAAAERTGDTTYTHSELAGSTTKYYKVAVTVTIDGKDFTGAQTGAVSATTEAPPEPEPEPEPAPSQPAPNNGGSDQQNNAAAPAGNTANSKKEQARAVAQQIADSIGPGTDLERVGMAAAIVSDYCDRATYTTSGSDYCEAYGVFIKGEYSCAGATRALGMVLECMGYQWQHVNENQWAHQWCILEMDGETGWADGQIGWAGYGAHPFV